MPMTVEQKRMESKSSRFNDRNTAKSCV